MADDLQVFEYGTHQAFDEWEPTVVQTAVWWAGKHARYVERADLSQYLWTKVLDPAYLGKIAGWYEEDKDPKWIARKVALRLRDWAKGYCLSEQARIAGFSRHDLTFYNTGLLRELLPAALDVNQWVHPGQDEREKVKTTTRPDEGGNRVATLADVASGVAALRLEDQRLLHLRYRDALTYAQIGGLLDVESDTAKHQCDRALKKLLEKLGGEAPIWPQGRRHE